MREGSMRGTATSGFTHSTHSRKNSLLHHDLMGAEQRRVEEAKEEVERKRKEQDTQSVFEIRKLFKFDNEFIDYVKKGGVDSAQRPVSAYTSGLMEQISEKFTKIVSQVNKK